MKPSVNLSSIIVLSVLLSSSLGAQPSFAQLTGPAQNPAENKKADLVDPVTSDPSTADTAIPASPAAAPKEILATKETPKDTEEGCPVTAPPVDPTARGSQQSPPAVPCPLLIARQQEALNAERLAQGRTQAPQYSSDGQKLMNLALDRLNRERDAAIERYHLSQGSEGKRGKKLRSELIDAYRHYEDACREAQRREQFARQQNQLRISGYPGGAGGGGSIRVGGSGGGIGAGNARGDGGGIGNGNGNGNGAGGGVGAQGSVHVRLPGGTIGAGGGIDGRGGIGSGGGIGARGGAGGDGGLSGRAGGRIHADLSPAEIDLLRAYRAGQRDGRGGGIDSDGPYARGSLSGGLSAGGRGRSPGGRVDGRTGLEFEYDIDYGTPGYKLKKEHHYGRAIGHGLLAVPKGIAYGTVGVLKGARYVVNLPIAATIAIGRKLGLGKLFRGLGHLFISDTTRRAAGRTVSDPCRVQGSEIDALVREVRNQDPNHPDLVGNTLVEGPCVANARLVDKTIVYQSSPRRDTGGAQEGGPSVNGSGCVERAAQAPNSDCATGAAR